MNRQRAWYALVLLFAAMARPATPCEEPGPNLQDQLRSLHCLLEAGDGVKSAQIALNAYEYGMPKDSLLYFLAEAAYRRGALDTALVYHYGIQDPAEGVDRPQVFLKAWMAQRQRLLAALEQNSPTEKAETKPPSDCALDTRPKPWIFQALGSLGYEATESRIPGEIFPSPEAYAGSWPARIQEPSTWETGPAYTGRMEGRRKLGQGAWKTEWGARYRFYKAYYRDSTEQGPGLLAAWKPEGLPGGLEFSLDGDLASDVSWAVWKPAVAVFGFHSGTPALVYAQAGAGWEGPRQHLQREFSAWLFVLAQRTGVRWTPGLSAMASHSSAGDIRQRRFRLYFIDHPGADPVIHYTGADFSTPLTPANRFVAPELYRSSFETADDIIPTRIGRVSLAPSLTRAFGKGWTWELSLEGALSWTWDPLIRWESDTPPADPYRALTEGQAVALSRDDGRVYPVLNEFADESYGPAMELTETRSRRIEWQGETRWRLERKAAGQVWFWDLRLCRTFSNLKESAWTREPDWSLGTKLGWRWKGFQ